MDLRTLSLPRPRLSSFILRHRDPPNSSSSPPVRWLPAAASQWQRSFQRTVKSPPLCARSIRPSHTEECPLVLKQRFRVRSLLFFVLFLFSFSVFTLCAASHSETNVLRSSSSSTAGHSRQQFWITLHRMRLFLFVSLFCCFTAEGFN